VSNKTYPTANGKSRKSPITFKNQKHRIMNGAHQRVMRCSDLENEKELKQHARISRSEKPCNEQPYGSGVSSVGTKCQVTQTQPWEWDPGDEQAGRGFHGRLPESSKKKKRLNPHGGPKLRQGGE